MTEGRLDTETLNGMKNMLAITISQSIDKLGFVPNESGPFIKEVMTGQDEIAIMCLGLALEQSMESGSYRPLAKGIDDIKRARAQYEGV